MMLNVGGMKQAPFLSDQDMKGNLKRCRVGGLPVIQKCLEQRPRQDSAQRRDGGSACSDQPSSGIARGFPGSMSST